MKTRRISFHQSVFQLILIATCMMLLSEVAQAQHYIQNNLVSDIPGMAAQTDSNLVNPWGLARSSDVPREAAAWSGSHGGSA